MGSVSDTFTDTAGTALTSHTTDSGHTWSVGNNAVSGIVVTDTNRVRGPATFTSAYTSWVPASADYDVEADAYLYEAGGSGRDLGPTGRQSTSADTYYRFVISFDVVYLQKRVAAVNTALASFDVGTPGAGSTWNLRLQMRGSTIKGFVNDVERCSVTDTSITATGRAGINTYNGTTNGAGNQLDNFAGYDPTVEITATTAGTSTTTGAGTVAWKISGTSVGTGSETAALRATLTLQATSLGTSSTTGAVTSTGMGGTSAATSTTTGSLRATWRLAATSAGVSATTGLMPSPFVQDSFSGTTGVNLTAHVGQVGATWTNHPTFPSNHAVITAANRARGSNAATQLVYASGVPTNADYDVTGDVVARSGGSGSDAGVAGRISTTQLTYYRLVISGLTLYLQVDLDATRTTLGTYAIPSISTDQVLALKLEMRGSSIKGYLDGVARITATDATVTAAGRAGVSFFGVSTDTTGNHVDNLVADNRIVVLGSGTSAGTSTTSGALTVDLAVVPGARPLTGTTTGSSGTTAEARATWTLTGSTAAFSATAGTVTTEADAPAPFDIRMSGITLGVSVTAGDAVFKWAMAGTSAGVGLTSGALGTTSLTGVSVGVSGTDGSLTPGEEETGVFRLRPGFQIQNGEASFAYDAGFTFDVDEAAAGGTFVVEDPQILRALRTLDQYVDIVEEV